MDPVTAADEMVVSTAAGMRVVKRRACVNCTTGKAKCTPKTEHICERCARLGKECMYLDLPQKRRRQRDTRRVEALESKVEGLLAQLAVLTDPNGNPLDGSGAINIPTPFSDDNCSTTGATTVALLSSAQSTTSSDPSASVAGTAGGFVSCRLTVPTDRDIVDAGLLTLGEARSHVDAFKNDYVQHFPFATLAPTETADSLRRDWPFLFQCIVAATAHENQPLQRALSEEIVRRASVRCVVNSERSLDLLRGMLVHAGWYHQLSQRDHSQVFMMTQLCVTLAYDLDLDRKKEPTHAQMRALLGTYWVSICAARSLGKQTSMRHSQRIDEYALKIATAPELPYDKCIRPFIMLETFALRLGDLYSTPLPVCAPRGESSVYFATDSLLRELQQIKASIANDVAASDIIPNLELHDLEACIREPALRDEFWLGPPSTASFLSQTTASTPSSLPPLPPPTSWSAASPSKSSTIRTSMLWQAVHSYKSYIQHFLAIPDKQLPYLSFAPFSRLCSALIHLAKAAWALLEGIAGSGRATPNSTITLSPTQTTEAQMVITEVNYQRSIHALLDKISTVTAEPLSAGWKKHILVVFCTKMRGFSLCYYKETQRFVSGAEDVFPMPPDMSHTTRQQQRRHLQGQKPLPVPVYTSPGTGSSTRSEELVGETDVTQMAIDPSMVAWDQQASTATASEDGSFTLEDWQLLGGAELLDQMLWNSVLNDFTGPGMSREY